jgi:hypothetical protein
MFVVRLVDQETRAAQAHLRMQIGQQVVQATAEDLGSSVRNIVLNDGVNAWPVRCHSD